ncbi:head decoration protein [Nitrospirillum viridazoti]|uniref:Head decoration protein n=1 Tax=Nitrospirillum viridazoti CBAmc TaxID=1441467 RepID=A0A248JRT6_9PROT|nr:head decoration protein [Nitrospirillum amazonense]ASG21405.1 head decoration protein [Nitrospirillum amazonense CBAmc]TWB33083.1 bacteriophage lambda head decoration protein D [Nitrospirillum amazonense]
MGAVFTEGLNTGEYLVSEANGNLSRDTITLAQSAAPYSAGQVLAYVAASDHYVAYDEAAQGDAAVAAAINFARVNASAGDVRATAHTNYAEINKAALAWAPGVTSAGMAAAFSSLRQHGIKAR